jgi:hypothetical protein
LSAESKLIQAELEASIESALNATTSSGLRRAVDRRLKERTVLNGYASRGWSAVFDSSWVEEVVAKGQSTTKEIEGVLDRLTKMPKPDVMRTLEIPVDVPSRRVSPPKSPLFGNTDVLGLDDSDNGAYNAGPGTYIRRTCYPRPGPDANFIRLGWRCGGTYGKDGI